MAKIGAAMLVSIITIALASSYLFSGNPETYRFVMQVAGCVFAAAFLFCIIKGLVLGFDSLATTATLNRVLGTNALIILTVFIISQANACTSAIVSV